MTMLFAVNMYTRAQPGATVSSAPADKPCGPHRAIAAARFAPGLKPCHLRSEWPRRGFSLVEVLLAIFILGIGIISIAALFPAGIAQQRRTVDEVMGPVVADNALSVLRSKLDASMFGTFEEFGPTTTTLPNGFPTPYRAAMPTVPGDWPWLRPGVMVSDVPDTATFDRGMIDVFSALYVRSEIGALTPVPNYENAAARMATEFPDGFATPIDDSMPAMPGGTGGSPLQPVPLFGIPFNRTRNDVVLQNLPTPLAPGMYPPTVTFTQAERTYPTRISANPSLNPGNLQPPEQQRGAQYYWDCMFRRFEGRIFVAIFVYRVTMPPGVNTPWHLSAHPFDGERAWLPYRRDLEGAGANMFADSRIGGNKYWDVPQSNDPPPSTVPGSEIAQDYAPLSMTEIDGEPRGVVESWQDSGQWILDQNNRVYRVVSRYEYEDDSSQRVELSRPIAPVTGTNFMIGSSSGFPTHSPYYYLGDPNTSTSFVFRDVVTAIWYMPRYVPFDTTGDGEADSTVTLTPVHVQVSEL